MPSNINFSNTPTVNRDLDDEDYLPKQAKKKTKVAKAKKLSKTRKTAKNKVVNLCSITQVSKEKSMHETKVHLKKIFLNYCEFNTNTGALLISQTTC